MALIATCVLMVIIMALIATCLSAVFCWSTKELTTSQAKYHCARSSSAAAAMDQRQDYLSGLPWDIERPGLTSSLRTQLAISAIIMTIRTQVAISAIIMTIRTQVAISAIAMTNH